MQRANGGPGVGATSRSARYDVAFYVPLIGTLLAGGRDLPPGGAETQIYLLSRALAAQGFRVCVVAYEGDGVPASFDGVDVVRRPPPQWKLRSGPGGKLAEVAAIVRIVRSIDARVFVQRGTSMETGVVALAARARRRRFVYSSANTIDFAWETVADRKNVALFRLGIRLADRIVVQTDEQVELCRRHFEREPVVIKSIAEPAAEPSEPAVSEAFLWVGKLASYKNPLAYVELARAVPEACFRLVGVPSEKDSDGLRDEVERAGAGLANLELIPPRPRAELMSLVDRAVAIVSTSDYEGMPNVLLEGWARGVPALVLGHDPDGVIARDGLGGCAGWSSGRLAELAREMWDSRTSRAALARRSREFVARNHEPDTVAARWAEALGLGDRGVLAGELGPPVASAVKG